MLLLAFLTGMASMNQQFNSNGCSTPQHHETCMLDEICASSLCQGGKRAYEATTMLKLGTIRRPCVLYRNLRSNPDDGTARGPLSHCVKFLFG